MSVPGALADQAWIPCMELNATKHCRNWKLKREGGKYKNLKCRSTEPLLQREGKGEIQTLKDTNPNAQFKRFVCMQIIYDYTF